MKRRGEEIGAERESLKEKLTAKEVSFEWLHHKIMFTSTKLRFIPHLLVIISVCKEMNGSLLLSVYCAVHCHLPLRRLEAAVAAFFVECLVVNDVKLQYKSTPEK